MGLGAVFHHLAAVRAGKTQNGIHIRALAVKMDRQNRSDVMIFEDAFKAGRTHGKAIRLNIRQNGNGSHAFNGRHCRHGGMGNRGDGISRPHADRAKRQLDGVRSAGDSRAVRRAAPFRKFAFKGFRFRPRIYQPLSMTRRNAASRSPRWASYSIFRSQKGTFIKNSFVV